MKFVIAPDSYKGSLSAVEVAEWMAKGIRDAVPDADIAIIPLADGGEGTVDAIIHAAGGTIHEEEVLGPLGDTVPAKYGILADGLTGVIEMAAASGLTLVPQERLNPLRTTTYGTGQLIKAALDRGCIRIIMGIGGSATNDGGVGLAQALGAHFYDDQGREIGFGGGELAKLHTIDLKSIDSRLAACEIVSASDVTNPLCGPRGASAVFGPQKGATPHMVEELDRGLAHLAARVKEQLGMDILDLKGGGAAGGLGAGLSAFLGAKMRRGIDIVLEITRFDEQVRDADFVFTGEGRTDGQTAFGKAPLGVAVAAKKHGKPVICISGGIGGDVSGLYKLGIDVVIGATQAPMTLEEAMRDAPDWVRHAARSAAKALTISASFASGGNGSTKETG
ncbi:glycerate kinase [Ferviditalea candida]|uniref:Glycerate kinase n=1 Tax=Ferviditalea candida TaxID=3108399 RepID=A0ABU5ZG89_9BACL|nr:glycerate kinase [Paenibacillaceae bacterium T2]